MALIDVIKYSGGPDVFAWKYPNEELGTWTQLIVNESQEAILFKGGKALDIFESGRHTLDTANIPLLNEIVKLPFGGRSPFSAEVWFINKASSLDVKWGTATPIQIQDPKYGVFIPVRSNGVFGIRISESKKFLIKLVGTMPVFDKDTLVRYFRGLYITKVKDAISQYVIQKQISVLEINAYIDELSNYINERIAPALDDFGIQLVNFYINDLSVPENDTAVVQLKAALAKRAEMNIIGYNYQQERSFDTLEGAAKNSGSASAPLMGAGLGLGMGVGMGGEVGRTFGKISSQIRTDNNEDTTKECPKCHSRLVPSQRFCGTCGFDTDEMKQKEKTASIKCSNCGAAMSKELKFCPECGNRYNPCPECGADMPDNAAACSICGYVQPFTCPECGKQILRGCKFCPECGAPLAKKCPKCGAAIEASPKFCPECGEKLE